MSGQRSGFSGQPERDTVRRCSARVSRPRRNAGPKASSFFGLHSQGINQYGVVGILGRTMGGRMIEERNFNLLLHRSAPHRSALASSTIACSGSAQAGRIINFYKSEARLTPASLKTPRRKGFWHSFIASSPHLTPSRLRVSSSFLRVFSPRRRRPTAGLLLLAAAFEYGGRLHFMSQHVKIDDSRSPERIP